MANEQSQNGRGEYQMNGMTYAKGELLNAFICLQGGWGVEKSVIRYVRTKWMDFCAVVQPSTLEHHRQQGNCCYFPPS